MTMQTRCIWAKAWRNGGSRLGWNRTSIDFLGSGVEGGMSGGRGESAP